MVALILYPGISLTTTFKADTMPFLAWSSWCGSPSAGTNQVPFCVLTVRTLSVGDQENVWRQTGSGSP